MASSRCRVIGKLTGFCKRSNKLCQLLRFILSGLYKLSKELEKVVVKRKKKKGGKATKGEESRVEGRTAKEEKEQQRKEEFLNKMFSLKKCQNGVVRRR